MKRLFVYGTLAPGKPNEHVLKAIGGTWEKGFVMGELYEEGWGADLGFPGIRLDHQKDKISGQVFTSPNLAAHWDELDQFEGEAYQRVKTIVELEEEKTEVEAYIYVLK